MEISPDFVVARIILAAMRSLARATVIQVLALIQDVVYVAIVILKQSIYVIGEHLVSR